MISKTWHLDFGLVCRGSVSGSSCHPINASELGCWVVLLASKEFEQEIRSDQSHFRLSADSEAL